MRLFLLENKTQNANYNMQQFISIYMCGKTCTILIEQKYCIYRWRRKEQTIRVRKNVQIKKNRVV